MTTRTCTALALVALLATSSACGGPRAGRSYQDPAMDFGSIKNIAVLPFGNLSRDTAAGDRFREVFSSALLASGAAYVIPQGEVARIIARLNVTDPRAPSVEEITKMGGLLKADAIIRGVVKEYGEVRSGTATGSVVSVSLEMYETATGKIVWSGGSTRGGVGFGDRLLGGGGQAMDGITEQVADDLLSKMLH